MRSMDVKAGEDYSTYQFTLLIILFLYILFFYNFMSRQRSDKIGESEAEMNFSSELVYLLFFIIAIILIDRFFYKVNRESHILITLGI